ncbi:hypothetical protein Btru_026147 [Bulinus truncatus]|nr:hypothetical protein Btru_026147 [Bulinus truncatus]
MQENLDVRISLNHGTDGPSTLSMWCEECGVSNIGECLIHGGDMTRAHDNTPPPKACLSLPKVLALKRAKNFDICSLEARKGVFAKKAVKIRTLFGPMEADVTESRPHLPPGSIEYQLHGKNGEHLYLDTSDKYKCNWMMFVRPANKYSQQNLAAFENNGQIFFVTCKNIPAGTELRVWYAAAYAKAIGKSCLMPEPSDRISIVNKAQKDAGNNQGIEPPQKESPWNAQEENFNGNENCLMLDKVQQVAECRDSSVPIATAVTEIISKTVSAVATRAGSNMLTCTECCMSFTRQRQLESHVCTLFRDKSDSAGALTRRRKGKPKKLQDNSEAVSPKTYRFNELPMVSFLCPEGLDENGDDMILKNEIKEEHFILPETLVHQSEHGLNTDAVVAPNKVKQKGHPGRPRKLKGSGDLLATSDKNTLIQKTFTCSSCRATFNSKDEFSQHNNCRPMTYICKYENCLKEFPSKFKYQRHKIIHEKPHNFQSTLVFHMAKHKANEGDSLQCLVCKENFPTNEELKKHVNVHNRYKREEKPRELNCPDCGKQFLSQKDIRRHRVTHTKERPFLCEHCPHTFVRKDHLRRHYSVSHKKELYELQLKSNPFGCHVCFQVFKKQEYLDYHNKTVHPDGVDKVEQKKVKEKVVKISHNETAEVFIVPKSTKSLVQGSVGRQTLLLKQQMISQQASANNQIESHPGQPLQLAPQQPNQPLPTSEPQSQDSEPYPVSVIKIRQPSKQNIIASAQPASIFYPSTLQTVTSQSSLFDTLGGEVITTSKTVPFRVHNQLLSQVQLQAPTSSHIQLENQQLQQQQQDQLHQHIQHDQQPQMTPSQQHPLLQQQLQQVQQYNCSNVSNTVQMQLQNLLLPQQFSVQHQHTQQGLSQQVGLIQGIKMSELQSAPNTNILIAVDGQNLINFQGLSLAKPVQHMIFKDNSNGGKQLMQHVIPTQQPEPDLKSDNSCLISCNGQIFRATLDSSTISQILNNSAGISDLKAVQVIDDETSRVIGQMSNNFISGHSIMKSMSQNLQIQNDVLVGQHSLQDQQQDQLQTQLQNQLLQQQHQQTQSHLQQQQILDKPDHQDLPSFSVTWPDNLDFKPVGEMMIPNDVSSSASLDSLTLSAGGCWILQQQQQAIDQQQIQHLQVQSQQLQSLPLFTLSSSAGTTPDS